MKYGMIAFLSIKRLLKKPLMLLGLLAVPCIYLALPMLEGDSDKQSMQAGICLEGEITPAIERILAQLDLDSEKNDVPDSQSEIIYRLYEHQDSMERALQNGEISCGFWIEKEFEKVVADGNPRNCVKMYVPKDVNYAGIIREDFQSRVYKVVSATWYAGQVNTLTGIPLSPEEVMGEIQSLRSDGNTFGVEYRNDISRNEAEIAAQQQASVSMFSQIGILAYVVFMLSAIGTMQYRENLEQKRMTGCRLQKPYLAIEAALPTAWGSIFLLAYAVTRDSGNPAAGSLILFILLYGSILWVLGILVAHVIPARWMMGMLPFVLLLGLICTPVFFSLGKTIPILGLIGKLYPVTWFLYLVG